MLRKGLPLEAALDIAARDLTRADDRGFAHAIAAEALRRLGDLDALIDSATKKRLPDDAKARFALRIALVQALALDTPPHAAIATVLSVSINTVETHRKHIMEKLDLHNTAEIVRFAVRKKIVH